MNLNSNGEGLHHWNFYLIMYCLRQNLHNQTPTQYYAHKRNGLDFHFNSFVTSIILTCIFEQMAFMANYLDKGKVVSSVSRIIVVLLFLTYFGASQVHCDEQIQFCNNALKKLQNDKKIIEDWRERCLKPNGHMLDSPCCETERMYLRQRKCNTHSRMCSVYKGSILNL